MKRYFLPILFISQLLTQTIFEANNYQKFPKNIFDKICCDLFHEIDNRDVFGAEHISLELEKDILSRHPIIIPIGCDCRMASRLRAMGIRKLAFPFDWYRSSLDIIFNCFEHDFDHFTDAQYIINSNSSDVYPQYFPVKQSFYGISFWHDFSYAWIDGKLLFVKEKFKEELEFMRDKYNARIGRLYRALAVGRPVYLCYCAPDDWDSQKVSIDFNKIWLRKLSMLLQQKFPQAKITIIYADFSPRITELQDIPFVKAYQIKYRHEGPQKEHNQQLVIDEWSALLKDACVL